MLREAPGEGNVPTRLLFFEPDLAGHQVHYLGILLHHHRETSAAGEVVVASDPAFPDLLKRHARFHRLDPGTNWRFLPLSGDDLKQCSQPTLVRRSLALWRTAIRLSRSIGADHLHFLHLDHLQFPLALRLSVPARTLVSGILFRPSLHLTSDRQEASIRERLQRLRRKVLYGGMLGHPAVRAVFSLDPGFPPYARARFSGGEKVVYLPDPAPSVRPAEVDRAAADPWHGAEGRVRFLLFGALSRRKGIFQVLRAVRLLSPEHRGRIAILFAGRLAASERAEFFEELARLAEAEGPQPWVRAEDRFLDDEEIAAFLLGCDAVLAPYQSFTGSSGVLLWGAWACRPVLCQAEGLMARTVRQHGLGLTVDALDPAAVAEGMARIMDVLPAQGAEALLSSASVGNFMAEHSPTAFARTLYSNVRATLTAA